MGREDGYHFLLSGNEYFIDDCWNVSSRDGTLVYDGGNDMSAGLSGSSFHIGGVPYFFNNNRLSTPSDEGNALGIQLWSGPLNVPNVPIGKQRKRDDEQAACLNGLVKVGNGTNRDIKPMPERNKHFFWASDRLYYFDDHRRLYKDNGTLVYDGSSVPHTKETSPPSFQIDGVPYWFEQDGLTTRDATGRRDRVYTWSSKGGSVGQHAVPDQGSINRSPIARPQPNQRPEFCDGLKSALVIDSVSGASGGTPKAKGKSCPSIVNPNPLPQTITGKPGILFSPALSDIRTPGSNYAAIGHVETKGPSLFAATKPSKAPRRPNFVLPPTATSAPGAPLTGQHVKKRGNEENKICPYCKKKFRRSCALEEHINTHTAAKPHICPFDSCYTGFATKQNVRRHIETYKIGKLDDYEPGVSHQPGEIKRQRREEPILPDAQDAPRIGQFDRSSDSSYGGTDIRSRID